MNQQEIKNNMTQTPWALDPSGFSTDQFGIIGKKAHLGVGIVSEGVCSDDFYKLEDVDLFAIKHAVNNTYGKGINPESVQLMYGTLDALSGVMDAKGFVETAGLIREVIKKATLTNDIPEQKEQQAIPKAPES